MSLDLQIITLKLQIHSEYEKYVVEKTRIENLSMGYLLVQSNNGNTRAMCEMCLKITLKTRLTSS